MNEHPGVQFHVCVTEVLRTSHQSINRLMSIILRNDVFVNILVEGQANSRTFPSRTPRDNCHARQHQQKVSAKPELSCEPARHPLGQV